MDALPTKVYQVPLPNAMNLRVGSQATLSYPTCNFQSTVQLLTAKMAHMGHNTWLALWLSLRTRFLLSAIVASKSCSTGASAGLAPPAHLSRCSILASSAASFSCKSQQNLSEYLILSNSYWAFYINTREIQKKHMHNLENILNKHLLELILISL